MNINNPIRLSFSYDSVGYFPSCPATTLLMKPKQRRNRQATEAAIIDAFERVIVRDGLAGANPTSVMQEAGFSKPLLYDYFGNMAGLAAAWSAHRRIWPDHEYPDDEREDGDFCDYLRDFLVSPANGLRENPVALELLAAELGRETDYQPVLEDSRKHWLRQNLQGMMTHPEIHEPQNWNLLFVGYSAIVYLALRSRRASPHAGIRLDTDEGWTEAMRHVAQLVDELALLARLKKILGGGRDSMLAALLAAVDEAEASV